MIGTVISVGGVSFVWTGAVYVGYLAGEFIIATDAERRIMSLSTAEMAPLGSSLEDAAAIIRHVVAHSGQKESRRGNQKLIIFDTG
jgi:hypothetical protein